MNIAWVVFYRWSSTCFPFYTWCHLWISVIHFYKFHHNLPFTPFCNLFPQIIEVDYYMVLTFCINMHMVMFISKQLPWISFIQLFIRNILFRTVLRTQRKSYYSWIYKYPSKDILNEWSFHFFFKLETRSFSSILYHLSSWSDSRI